MAKLTEGDHKKFLHRSLEEQRHFLRKSIKEFTSGDLAEAVRIATTMRVLVHETGSSKPLLKQLTSNYLELTILDSAPKKEEEEAPQGMQGRVVMSVPVSLKISADGVFLNPTLAIDRYAPSILGKWWVRECLIVPGLGGFSRKELVLGLANKEGGAHVDTDMPRTSQKLLESKSFQIGWSKEATSPLNLSRYMTGQAGIELLDCLDKNFPTVLEK
jgi:hypothetical protein